MDEAVNILSLKSPSVRTVIIDYENKFLEFDSYKKSFLPSISLSLTPFNFNRSINLLQNPSDGTYRYVEDYLGNTSAGLSLSQRIGITGGNLTINTNQNFVNEFSNSRRTFNSVPFSISYSQSLFGCNKKYKYEKEINYKENSISKLNYCLEILKVQKQISTYYISTYTAMLEEEMAVNSFEQSDSLLSIAKIKLDNDNITQHDFDLIKIKKSESEYQLKEVKIKHENYLKKLLIFLGLPTNNLQGYKLFKPNISLPDNLDRDVVYLFVNKNNPFSLAQEIKKAKIKLNLFNKKLKNSFNSNVRISYWNKYFEIRTISLHDFIGNNEIIPTIIANTNNNANRNQYKKTY